MERQYVCCCFSVWSNNINSNLCKSSTKHKSSSFSESNFVSPWYRKEWLLTRPKNLRRFIFPPFIFHHIIPIVLLKKMCDGEYFINLAIVFRKGDPNSVISHIWKASRICVFFFFLLLNLFNKELTVVYQWISSISIVSNRKEPMSLKLINFYFFHPNLMHFLAVNDHLDELLIWTINK